MGMANLDVVTCPACFQIVGLYDGRLMTHQSPTAGAENEICSTSGLLISELFVCDICGRSDRLSESPDGIIRCPDCRKLSAKLHGESL